MLDVLGSSSLAYPLSASYLCVTFLPTPLKLLGAGETTAVAASRLVSAHNLPMLFAHGWVHAYTLTGQTQIATLQAQVLDLTKTSQRAFDLERKLKRATDAWVKVHKRLEGEHENRKLELEALVRDLEARLKNKENTKQGIGTAPRVAYVLPACSQACATSTRTPWCFAP